MSRCEKCKELAFELFEIIEDNQTLLVCKKCNTQKKIFKSKTIGPGKGGKY